MAMAEDIAGRIPPPAEESAEGEGVMPGDHGAAIRAAIEAKDDVALEEAIKACVDAPY